MHLMLSPESNLLSRSKKKLKRMVESEKLLLREERKVKKCVNNQAGDEET